MFENKPKTKPVQVQRLINSEVEFSDDEICKACLRRANCLKQIVWSNIKIYRHGPCMCFRVESQEHLKYLIKVLK